jgi:G:T/U-mismatch repair DNA glycosylase
MADTAVQQAPILTSDQMDALRGGAQAGMDQLHSTGSFTSLTPAQNIASAASNISYPTAPNPVSTTPTPTPNPVQGYKVPIPGANPFTHIVPGFSNPAGPTVTATNAAPTTVPTPTTVPNPTGQTDGSVHLNVNGTVGTDVPVFKGTSFESGSDLAKQLGLDYKADPTTGEITIGGTKVMPTSYDKQGNAMVGVRQVANALGYQIGYDDKSKTITVTGKPTTPPGGTGSGDVNQGWQAPDMSSMQGNMMPYGTFNNDMSGYYTQAHNQLDAQYQQQKKALLDKQQTDITASDESMNKRGIYSSGVAQSVEDDLRTKTTQAVANVLSNQMAAVAKTAQGLYDTAYKQYLDGNKFALENNKSNVANILAVEKQSFNEYLATHKLSDAELKAANDEYDKQADRIQKTQINDSNNQVKMDIAEMPYKGTTVYQQMSLQEKAAMDSASNYFKQQGISVDHAKLAESIRSSTASETNVANGQQITKDHNAATEADAAAKLKDAEAKSTTIVDPRKSTDNSTFYKSSLANPGKDANGKAIKVTNASALQFAQTKENNLTPTDYQDLVAYINATYKN